MQRRCKPVVRLVEIGDRTYTVTQRPLDMRTATHSHGLGTPRAMLVVLIPALLLWGIVIGGIYLAVGA